MSEWIVNSKTGLIDDIRQLSSPNFDQRPDGIEIDVLVVHAISLPPNQFGDCFIEEFFTNRLDCSRHPYFEEIQELRVSAHFLIERTGRVTQFVSTHNRAWHAGVSCLGNRQRLNDFSIGVELEGCDDFPFEEIQYQSLAVLCRCLMQAYRGIQKDSIVGHSDIAPGRKTDPGPHFDWQNLHRRLQS